MDPTEEEIVRRDLADLPRPELEALAFAYWKLLEDDRRFDHERARSLIVEARTALGDLGRMLLQDEEPELLLVSGVRGQPGAVYMTRDGQTLRSGTCP